MAASGQEAEAETAPPVPVVSFKKRNPRAKGNIRKRPAPESPEQTASRDDDSDSSFSEDESRQRPAVKRRLQNSGVVSAASTTTSGGGVKADPERLPTASQSANSKPPPPQSSTSAAKDDATKTNKGYDEEATKSRIQVGPTRAANNVRMTTFMDYAPDVCKDYKKTGFCGFGDNCVFLHDRGDYKQGWELDRDWDDATKNNKGQASLSGTVISSASAKRNNKAGDDDEDEEDEEMAMLKNIPFACIICEQPYKSPIVTRCGHYFCEACALKRYRKDPSCVACGASTQGVFNSASRLNKLLQRKRERAAKSEAEREESDEDEGGG